MAIAPAAGFHIDISHNGRERLGDVISHSVFSLPIETLFCVFGMGHVVRV